MAKSKNLKLQNLIKNTLNIKTTTLEIKITCSQGI